MKAAFHYVVKAKLIRFHDDNYIDFQELEEVFENEEPIIAREEAFNRYQSYIDVLLESKNKKYTTDRNAREVLKSFYETDVEITIGNKMVNPRNSAGFGLGIFMVIDKPMADEFPSPPDRNFKEEWFIHGIGDVGDVFYIDDDYLIISLGNELRYYKYYNYSTGQKETEVVYCSKVAWQDKVTRDFEPSLHHLLETPFDWKDFDKPYWWGESEQEPEPDQIPKSIEEIIVAGESNQVEFKPALIYNFKTHKGGIGVKAIIAKAICAFLNSNGGYLIIGINNEGEIQGLDYDFMLAGDKNPKDFFRLEFDQMVEHFLSFSVKNNVVGEFYEEEGKDVFIVTVFPNKRRPIFLNGQNGKEFYVRGEGSSRLILDIEDIVNYCIDRFSVKNQ